MESLRAAFIPTGSCGTVSYTHLDVYKRQVGSTLIPRVKSGQNKRRRSVEKRKECDELWQRNMAACLLAIDI